MAELDDQQHKGGLGEVYAEEFKAATQGVSASEEQLKVQHEEIDSLFGKLDQHLTALCNFSYTPVQPEEQVTVITNAPAVQLEDGKFRKP